MSQLSVCVLSIRHRAAKLSRLLSILSPQIIRPVELLLSIDDGAAHRADKRNQLLHAARGEYVCFIDDDDRVASNYVAALLAGTKENPDCIGFRVARYEDGKLIGEAAHSLRYREPATRQTLRTTFWERTPNHLNPVRAELAREVGFKRTEMEDVDYARRLRPLLNTETFVDEILYHYELETPRMRAMNI